MSRNIEIKVACTEQQFAEIRGRLYERTLTCIEHMSHCDTYLQAVNGRLKLREMSSLGGRSAELIQYDRPDVCGARTSTYQRVPLIVEHVADVKSALIAALGELVTVRKERTVAIWQSTRVHLDQVDGLGLFVELETVLNEDGTDAADGQIEFDDVCGWLGLTSMEAIAGSYSDLTTRKGLLV